MKLIAAVLLLFLAATLAWFLLEKEPDAAQDSPTNQPSTTDPDPSPPRGLQGTRPEGPQKGEGVVPSRPRREFSVAIVEDGFSQAVEVPAESLALCSFEPSAFAGTSSPRLRQLLLLMLEGLETFNTPPYSLARGLADEDLPMLETVYRIHTDAARILSERQSRGEITAQEVSDTMSSHRSEIREYLKQLVESRLEAAGVDGQHWFSRVPAYRMPEKSPERAWLVLLVDANWPLLLNRYKDEFPKSLRKKLSAIDVQELRRWNTRVHSEYVRKSTTGVPRADIDEWLHSEVKALRERIGS